MWQLFKYLKKSIMQATFPPSFLPLSSLLKAEQPRKNCYLWKRAQEPSPVSLRRYTFPFRNTKNIFPYLHSFGIDFTWNSNSSSSSPVSWNITHMNQNTWIHQRIYQTLKMSTFILGFLFLYYYVHGRFSKTEDKMLTAMHKHKGVYF